MLRVIARSDFLDRNGIRDPTYIYNTFDNNRILACKYPQTYLSNIAKIGPIGVLSVEDLLSRLATQNNQRDCRSVD